VQVSAKRLRSFVPLKGLVDTSLELLARYAEVFRLAHGESLFELGDRSPYSYLLLEGELQLSARDGTTTLLHADHEQALYPVGNLVPRQISVRVASAAATLARIDRDLLEKELTWGQLGDHGEPPICEISGLPQENRQWMLALLHSPLFFRLPMSNVQQLLRRFKEIPYERNEVILREGDPGDRYFVIRSGSCRVTRRVGGRDILLNRMQAPEGFGEQALIAEQPRVATVVMETQGGLMSLAKEDFFTLMQAPLQKRIGLAEALDLVWNNRGRLIDVRSEAEFARGHLAEARNIPLYLLYLKSDRFVPTRYYIVYCDSGNRSEAAAFLLTQRGFNAYVLEGAAEALATVS